MSDTVDNVMDTVNESEPVDVVVSEETEPVEGAPAEEAAEPVAEPEPAEEVPVEEEPEPEPVAEEVAEPEPVAEEPAPSEHSVPVSTQEIVQNVQEILSSTETNVSVDNRELENRVKVLEERLERLVNAFKNYTGIRF
jgi:hypothetical protein